MKLEAIQNELMRRIAAGEGCCEIVMRRTGKRMYIYQQDMSRCFAVYFDDGNIWERSEKPVLFPYKEGGIKKLAEYIASVG
jgi:hypothetical protein